MQHVAVVGLGIIGSGIASNLIRAGFPVTVYNRSADKAAPFVRQGARQAATPREAAENADVVICAVANDEASRAIWLGEDGALAGARNGAILVECSTLSPDWVEQLAAEATARPTAGFLDAPVLGSKPAADAGELRLIVGGHAATLEAARPVLEAFSADIQHLGPNGAGARMKLINNAMGAVQIIALAEGLVVAERAGLNLDQVVRILSNGAPASPMVKGRIERMAQHAYDDVHFALRWMLKDTLYSIAEARDLAVPTPSVEAARAVLQAAVDQGYGDLDLAAVIEVVRASHS